MKEINLAKAMKAAADYRAKKSWSDWTARTGHREAEKAAAETATAFEAYQSAALPIMDAITAAEGRATARTIKSAEILEALEAIESKLDISKKAMEGIAATVDINAQTFPNAYKYIPESTHFKARYTRGHWILTDIYRARTSAPGSRYQIELTEAAKAAVIERMQHFDN